jgi:hypothetical protein
MSLLLLVKEDERVVAVTDTPATDTDGAPNMFATDLSGQQFRAPACRQAAESLTWRVRG